MVLEDDHRVAYAYLLDGERIVADVWLYNVSPSPESEEWSDRSRLPFLNPKPFCLAGETLPRLSIDSEVTCLREGKYVDVKLGDEHVARFKSGVRPGWSKLAAKAGPLALPLSEILSRRRAD